MSCHVMSCHVMSCHVMSCRHYCIEFLKKSFSKTFLFHKIIYKYFAGLLAIMRIATLSLAMTRLLVITGATPEVIHKKGILLFWIATLSLAHAVRLTAMTKLLTVITSVSEVIYLVDCHDFGRSLAMTWKIKIAMTKFVAMTEFFAMTIKFNLISFRDFSLLFIKKFITKGDLNYVKSQI